MDGITINLAPLLEFINLPIDMMLWRLLVMFGWIPITAVIFWGGIQVWIDYINNKWAGSQKKILLAIDIPKGNEQSPKAVEHLFSYILGAHGSINLIETYWEGKFQLSLSFEIVSIEGYTQFIIRTPAAWRELVETAVYSQYPDAEITEIQDYTQNVPHKFPDETYDVTGADFVLPKSEAYPIKTYIDFEDKLSAPGAQYKDTMATLMDLCSSLRKGEQLWFQIVAQPVAFDWGEPFKKEIDKIIGNDKPKQSAIAKYFSEFLETLGLPGLPAPPAPAEFSMMKLTPSQKNQIEAITRKIDKFAYKCKMRFVYIAKKDIMNKPKVQNGFVGFMKQFASVELNNIKPDTKYTLTSTNYFFKTRRLNRRKNRLVENYVNRDGTAGANPQHLNIEELATLWHFPIEMVVKAPMVQKAPGRKAEPPMSLPYDTSESKLDEEPDEIFITKKPSRRAVEERPIQEDSDEDIFAAPKSPPAGARKGASPPSNLPFG